MHMHHLPPNFRKDRIFHFKVFQSKERKFQLHSKSNKNKKQPLFYHLSLLGDAEGGIKH